MKDACRYYHQPRPEGYDHNAISYWVEVTRRQYRKDVVIFQHLCRYFDDGEILELGAGVGSLATMLRDRGFDVIPTDVSNDFVNYMRSVGLPAYRLDLLNADTSVTRLYNTVLCQSISPFLSSDPIILRASYEGVVRHMAHGGVLINIHAMGGRRHLRQLMRDHLECAERVGLRKVKVFRNQLLPSVCYRPPLTAIAAKFETLFGHRWGNRFVLIGYRN